MDCKTLASGSTLSPRQLSIVGDFERIGPLRDNSPTPHDSLSSPHKSNESLQQLCPEQIDDKAFRLLADAIPALCWIANANGYVVWYNQRWHDYCGSTLEEMEGWAWQSVYSPDILPGLKILWSNALKTGEAFELTSPIKSADGQYRPFLMKAAPVLDADGRVQRWYGINVDVSAQVQQERDATAAESQANMDAERVRRALASGAIIGTWLWDLVKDHFTVDEPFAIAFGIEASLGREGLNLEQVIAKVHPEDKPGLILAIEEAIERGGPYSHDYRVCNLNGTYQWIQANGEVQKDLNGVSVFFPGVLIDVERRRAADAERLGALERLRESEQRFRAAVDAVEGILWTNNAAGEMVGEQPGWAALTGQTFEEYKGFGWADVVHPEDAEASVDAWKANLPTRQIFKFEHRIRRRDGEWRRFSIRAIPIFNDGEVREWVGVHTDVTEAREAEQRELLLSREVDHRAKNIMAVVQSIVQLTKAGDIESFRDVVTGRINNLARTHSLLAEKRWVGVELHQLVTDELAVYVNPGSKENNARAHIHGHHLELPPATAQSIALVIHELATNAAKYGALSVPTGYVDVRWQVVEERPSHHVFHLRWLEGNASSVVPPEELGFGWKLIRQTIEHQLKGSIDQHWHSSGLELNIKFGIDAPTRFHVTAVESEASDVDTLVMLELSPKLILVLDDEPLIAMQLEIELESAGYAVLGPAYDVPTALDLIIKQKPDAAILDINLRGETSESVASALRKEGVPFIYCTGNADTSHFPKELQSKCLNKPFQQRALKSALVSLLKCQV